MVAPHAIATFSMPPGAEGTNDEFGPWHPGIRSQVPRDLLHLPGRRVETGLNIDNEERLLHGRSLEGAASFYPPLDAFSNTASDNHCEDRSN